MTEEEYFRKNYPDFCYGDKPLSPNWDFFQDGVEFGERQSEKKIAKHEEKISVLLSCKNCPENKGGYICAKEYENKCLAQKIEFIKELEKENVMLESQIEGEKEYSTSLNIQKLTLEKEKCKLLGIIQEKDKAIAELEKENTELKHDVEIWKKASETNGYKAFKFEEENAELKEKQFTLRNERNTLVRTKMTEVKTYAVNTFYDTDKIIKDLKERGYKIIATSTDIRHKAFTVVYEKE